jgi:hypothetical protein
VELVLVDAVGTSPLDSDGMESPGLSSRILGLTLTLLVGDSRQEIERLSKVLGTM